MNLLLQQFLDSEGLREEARTWLRREQPIDVNFLLNHNPQIQEAHDNEEVGAYLAGVTLPHFDSEDIKGHWAAAERSDRPPIDGLWFQLVDLPDGLSLLVPEEEDPTERILLFSPTFPSGLLEIVAFDILGSRISAFRPLDRDCTLGANGYTCWGNCPHAGRYCALMAERGYEHPYRRWCECWGLIS